MFGKILKRIGKYAIVRDGAGNFAWVRDPGGEASWYPGGIAFRSHLFATHFMKSGREKRYDLGSGLVTNLGVLTMANDFAWASPSGTPLSTLAVMNFHGSGTGSTAAAATDITIQTQAGPTTAATGTQSLVSAANSQKYQTIGTINYLSSLAITEWGLFATSAYAGVTTGSPFTATSASTATATGTPFTASTTSVRGDQQLIVVPGTTAVWGLVLSNTTSVLTIPAWYKVSDGTAGSTPGSTEAYHLYPSMWDHKVFSAINVNSGDSIQFTYQLTISSGG